MLHRVAETRSRELFTLSVLVIALGIAVGSAQVFGVSMALGAFLAGLVVGRSDFSVRAASDALPMRDAFAVLFFVSVGMLLSPRQMLETPGLLFATLAIVLIGKPLAALAITTLFRQPLRVGLMVAVALAQVGEFSFIVANLGASLGVITPEATNIIIAAAIVSITLNPILYRAVDRMTASRSQALTGDLAAAVGTDPPAALHHRHRTVVVGYGPVGRTVTRLLIENDIEPTVVELNIETVQSLRTSGIRAVYGDAGQSGTLQQAGVATARSLIFSADGIAAVHEGIRVARELNPRVQILARTAYIRDQQSLKAAGADVVFSGEGEVALTLTESILTNLGATAEQIERERVRVHAELI
jgi:CPA2 family monovalent cation:H+ antiporter-2